MEYPPLVDLVKNVWPSDVVDRARELHEVIGSVGAYSHSKGVPFIRKSVAKFIEGVSPLTSASLPARPALTHVQNATGSPATPKTSS